MNHEDDKQEYSDAVDEMIGKLENLVIRTDEELDGKSYSSAVILASLSWVLCEALIAAEFSREKALMAMTHTINKFYETRDTEEAEQTRH